MKNYTFPLHKDEHGQPFPRIPANEENNTRKAVSSLYGICAGILADGIVNEAEAQFFANWVRSQAPERPVWPFTDLLQRIQRIFADGICDQDEREELKAVMESICGHTSMEPESYTSLESQNYTSLLPFSTAFPLDNPLPDNVVFQDRDFCITGKFAYGTRKKVIEAIEAKGGTASDSKPKQATNYLVIGAFASRDWKHTNLGLKIERAVELRAHESGISILSEEHWKQFLD